MRAKEYRKKPVVIEAVQWTGKNISDIIGFFGGAAMCEGQDIIIGTLEGEMRAMPGDWIIKGVKGEFSISPQKAFLADYEEVSAFAGLDEWTCRDCAETNHGYEGEE